MIYLVLFVVFMRLFAMSIRQLPPRRDRTGWQFVFHGAEAVYMGPGWHSYSIGIIKVTNRPADGIGLNPSHYKGFLLPFHLWLPFA